MPTAASVHERAAINSSALIGLELFTSTPASILADGLMGLPTAERLVLSLMYFHELSFEDVASVMKLDAREVLRIHALAVDGLSKLVAANGKPVN